MSSKICPVCKKRPIKDNHQAKYCSYACGMKNTKDKRIKKQRKNNMGDLIIPYKNPLEFLSL
jgi:hypothetical protein